MCVSLEFLGVEVCSVEAVSSEKSLATCVTLVSVGLEG